MQFLQISVICRLTIKAQSGLRGIFGILEPAGHAVVLLKLEDPATGNTEQRVLFDGVSQRESDFGGAYGITQEQSANIKRQIYGALSDLGDQGWDIRECLPVSFSFLFPAQVWDWDSQSWGSRDAGTYDHVTKYPMLAKNKV